MASAGRGLLALSLILVSCTNRPCRQDQPIPTVIATAASSTAPSNVSGNVPDASPSSLSSAVTKSVFVSKSDGSRQCQPNSGLSLEAMEKKDLAGIRILSKTKKHDGKMRTQVCGSATGMMNVYEIIAEHLPLVEKKGFQKANP